MWLSESNRMKHLKVGLVIYALWMVVPCLRGGDMIIAALRALCVVAIAMLCVEYGQKTCGSKFDWLDVLAGCLVPLVLTAAICVLYFII